MGSGSGSSSTSGFGSSSTPGTGTSATAFGGAGPIVGFTLPVNKPSIVDYMEQTRYNKWEFNYDPMADQMQQAASLFGGAADVNNSNSATTANGVGNGGDNMGFGSSTGFGGTSSGFGNSNSGFGGSTSTNSGSSGTSGTSQPQQPNSTTDNPQQ